MKHREAYKHPSFTLLQSDLTALDALAEALCLRNRSEVVRCLIRAEIRKLHLNHKKDVAV